MTITLYQFATSPFTEKVRRALNYKGLAFDVHDVDRMKARSGGYGEVSESGKFPAIVDDGTVVLDSTDIMYHLEAAYPEPPLVPEDARDHALAHAIEEWADESLYFYEMTMRLTWENNLEAALDEFAETLPGVPKPQLKELIRTATGEIVTAQGIGRKSRSRVVADATRHFEMLEKLLQGRDWLVGDHASFADFAVIGQLNALLYAEEARAAAEGKQAIADWMARLDEVAPK
ncbi:MAG: glutathione S-transferase family protein [Gammaproteobacteria bacterium]|nr:glutathione S-transferase family protein [Gammaproteobacteria bacterium]MCY4322328.1 glutathione S-transferase family protein [Gammaproteobacteria bacterium]